MNEFPDNSIAPRTPDETPFTLAASVVLLIASITFGFTLTMILTVAAMTGIFGGTPGDGASKFILLIGTVAFIVPAYVWMRRSEKQFIPVFRVHAVSLSTILYTLVLALGLVIVTDAIDKAISPAINDFLDHTIGVLSPELQSEKILERLAQEFKIHTIAGGLFLILAAVGAAGLCEEMLLRGMFQGALEKRMNAGGAIAISSFVFALIHFNPWGGIQIFILAVFLGLVAWRTNSIIPTVIMHGMNNFIVILFNNINPENLTWYGDEKHIQSYVIFIGLLLTGIGLTGILNSNRSDEKKPG